MVVMWLQYVFGWPSSKTMMMMMMMHIIIGQGKEGSERCGAMPPNLSNPFTIRFYYTHPCGGACLLNSRNIASFCIMIQYEILLFVRAWSRGCHESENNNDDCLDSFVDSLTMAKWGNSATAEQLIVLCTVVTKSKLRRDTPASNKEDNIKI